MTGIAMAKKGPGRPKSSARQDITVKFDKRLAGLARLIAKDLNLTFVEYLSDVARPQIERDYAKIMRRLGEKD